jgi:hypothetical protein
MPSFSSLPLDWFLFILLVAISVMALWAFHHWWKKDRYTRERFAFFGFSALLGFGMFYIGSLSFNISMFGGMLFILLKPFGLSQPFLPLLTPIETLVFTFLFGSLIYAYIQIFKHWNGQKSLAQHEQEQNRENANVLRDIALLLSFKREIREKLVPYIEDAEQSDSVLEKPESLAWHVRARQLWLLHNRSYLFDDDKYDPSRKCWLGEEKNTGALVLLACHHEAPSDDTLSELVKYARRIVNKQGQTEIELIVALKNTDSEREEKHPDYSLKYTSEAVLLQDLVDFSDYFADIRYRVERAKLVDSDLTLQKTYTPSFYSLEKKGEVQDNNLEEFILDWLKDNNRRQLAVLGEYGQGKSTGSLLLSYRLINQAQTDTTTRIPILIELRGKTLRTMQPEELLATWAYLYRIDVKALLHLHIAGRLLLIFEGFDEIDLSGNTVDRINHFRTLWDLNYEQAKIIITGRPNFFLDSKELKLALGTTEQTHTLHLASFNIDQITNSLLAVDKPIREEIITLAKQNKKFYEVVARPSLLYIVAVLWQREKLSERQQINSALVIDLFIRQTLKRQQGKHDKRPFMVLNSAERHYFMVGIAAYMAAKSLPNQINNDQLEEAVRLLVDAIPDVVSQSVSTVGNENSHPLRSEKRFKWQTERTKIMDEINTDVRSCGLLITDPSKDGAFKFSHKSYMELLQAQVISQLFLVDDEVENISGRSITNTWKLKIDDLQDSDEAISFLAELLRIGLYKQNISEDLAVAKGLFDVLVIGKFSTKHTFSSFILLAANSLTGWLVSRFGIENRRSIGMGLYIGVIAVTFFTAAVAAVAVAAAAAVAAFAVVAAAAAAFADDAVVTAAFAAAFAADAAFAVVAAVVAAAVVAAAFAAAAVAVAAAAELVGKFGWLWQDALLLTVLTTMIVLPIGLVVGMASNFLIQQENPIFKRLRLWYRACKDLALPLSAIKKTVGKGMVALLENAEEQRER